MTLKKPARASLYFQPFNHGSIALSAVVRNSGVWIRSECEIARRECDFALISYGSGDVLVVESDSRKNTVLQAIFNNGVVKLKEFFRCA